MSVAKEEIATEAMKKKRGRKPKSLVQPDDNEASVSSVVANTPTPTIEEPLKKGKRGRRPKQVISSVEMVDANAGNDDGTGLSSMSDDENVIVRLNVNDANQEINDDDDEHPYAYNQNIYDNVFNVYGDKSTDKEDESVSGWQENNSSKLKIIDVLKDFEEKNKHNEWPLHTSVSCYWCCHRFNNPPIGIPINLTNDTFEVYGCFCSTNCAASYNFNEHLNQDESWERYQLLNLMSRRMGDVPNVKPAPPRLSLKIFGGHLDIDAFRAYTKGSKFVNVNFPPMTSVTQQLEEISDYELYSECRYIPVDNERINKYKEKISFRRNKPLIDTKKSIESTMNLRFSSA
jgi:hypothetical protein